MFTVSGLGTKRNCPKCDTKFYDLGKTPAQCPKCAHAFSPEVSAKKTPKKIKPVKASKPPKPARLEENEEDLDLSEFEAPDDVGGGEDELENLDDLDELGDGELEALPEVGEREREEDIMNSDDAEDDAFIEEMDEVETLVDKPEDEELSEEEEE